MISIIYFACLIVSIGNLLHLTQKKNEYADKYYWTMAIIIPIIILGYWMKSISHSPEAALVSTCFIYLDGTVLLVLVLFAAMKSINMKITGRLKMVVYGITALHLLSIWLCKDNSLYYSSVVIETTEYGIAAIMKPGPLKITHYIYIAIIFAALVSILICGYAKKKLFSRKTLDVYTLLAIFCIIIYAVELIYKAGYTVMPVLYALGSFMVTLSYNHIQSHDIYNLIGKRQTESDFRGFCAIDLNRCLLGYNKLFCEMVPEVCNINIDSAISDDSFFSGIVTEILDSFEDDGKIPDKISVKDKVFAPVISYFSINDDKPDGFLLELSNITEEQKQLDVVKQYNERLAIEIDQKTEHILDIQNAVVLGLADMVENRDESTGGHVKRTSDVVRILMSEIRKQGAYRLDSVTVDSIVKAAAMHDLGKISIDSAILCKPGKLTEEEYKCIKTHAQKSGDIVRIILGGVEEEHFVQTAYNLARYHHERWDGTGYPEGLMGESIPVEARIMAVADVYDALVSKRCYKEAMSYEQAAKIMNECMGSQFDPAMRPIFAACREKLEAYYSFEI